MICTLVPKNRRHFEGHNQMMDKVIEIFFQFLNILIMNTCYVAHFNIINDI